MTDPTPNPYAVPQAELADPGAAGGTELAGRGTRLGAAIIDAVLLLIIVMPVMVFATMSGLLEQDSFVSGLVGGLFGMGVYLLLNGWWLHKDGQSIGKKLCKVRIVRSDGSRATFGRIIGLRMLPFWLLGLIPYAGNLVSIVDALFIFRKSRKCLHDDLADTVVVTVD